MKSKAKVLFIMQLTPPVHGASVTGESIRKSQAISSKFDCHFIRISTVSEKGGLLMKWINLIKLYFNTLFHFIKNNYDLVYITPCSSGFLPFYKDFGLCVISKLFCKQVIYHYHDKGISTNRNVPSFIFKIYFRRVKVILSSPRLYYDIKKYVKPDDVYYCPYGIYDKVELPDLEKKPDNKVAILFLAHMLRTKGVFDLLEACKILANHGVNFVCKFVGSWYDITEEEFIQFVRINRLEEKIKFLGPQYGQDKDKVLCQSDIFCLPTFYPMECFPLIILDAMRWNLPVISTSEGAISEIIDHGVNGFVVNKNSPQELAEKINYLIHHNDVRIKMGAAGRQKFVNRYTFEIFENTLTDIFCKVISKGRLN